MNSTNDGPSSDNKTDRESKQFSRSAFAINTKNLLDICARAAKANSEHAADRRSILENLERLANAELLNNKTEGKTICKAAAAVEEFKLEEGIYLYLDEEVEVSRDRIRRFNFSKHKRPDEDIILGAAWYWKNLSMQFRDRIQDDPNVAPLELRNSLDKIAGLVENLQSELKNIPMVHKRRLSIIMRSRLVEFGDWRMVFKSSNVNMRALELMPYPFNILDPFLSSFELGVNETKAALQVRRGPRERHKNLTHVVEVLACLWYAITGRKPTSPDKTGNFVDFAAQFIVDIGLDARPSEIRMATVDLVKHLKQFPHFLLKP
jgi:hypothetical protein